PVTHRGRPPACSRGGPRSARARRERRGACNERRPGRTFGGADRAHRAAASRDPLARMAGPFVPRDRERARPEPGGRRDAALPRPAAPIAPAGAVIATTAPAPLVSGVDPAPPAAQPPTAQHPTPTGSSVRRQVSDATQTVADVTQPVTEPAAGAVQAVVANVT